MKSNSLMLIAALGTLTAVGVYVVRADEDRSSTPDAEARTKPQVDAASARERVEERAPATREEVERRGADALAYVLGGGGGAMDYDEADRDEEAFPRPETLEDAQAQFGDRLKEIEEALASGQELDAEQRQELRQGVSLALSDLTDHLDLKTTDGKDAYVEARSSARGAMLGLGPSTLTHREELLASHRGDGGEVPSPGTLPTPPAPPEEPAGQDPVKDEAAEEPAEAAEDEVPGEAAADDPELEPALDAEE